MPRNPDSKLSPALSLTTNLYANLTFAAIAVMLGLNVAKAFQHCIPGMKASS